MLTSVYIENPSDRPKTSECRCKGVVSMYIWFNLESYKKCINSSSSVVKEKANRSFVENYFLCGQAEKP